MKINIELKFELPVITKFLFCLPLQKSLVIWGYVQLVLNLIYAVFVVVEFEKSAPYYSGSGLVLLVLIFMLTMIWTFIDTLFCGFLILGAQRKNGNFLEVCFDYLKVKVPVIGVLFLVTLCVGFSFDGPYWFIKHFDSVMVYLLWENPAVMALLWLTQLYLLLLVNGLILSIDHHTEFRTLYQRIRHGGSHTTLTQNIIHEYMSGVKVLSEKP